MHRNAEEEPIAALSVTTTTQRGAAWAAEMRNKIRMCPVGRSRVDENRGVRRLLTSVRLGVCRPLTRLALEPSPSGVPGCCGERAYQSL